jgi:hypothetical protein
VTLRGLDLLQRSALADLLGLDRPPPGETTVPVATLDAVLRSSVGLDARSVVAVLVGPIDNRAERREADRLARAEPWGWLERHEVVSTLPCVNTVRRCPRNTSLNVC